MSVNRKDDVYPLVSEIFISDINRSDIRVGVIPTRENLRTVFSERTKDRSRHEAYYIVNELYEL